MTWSSSDSLRDSGPSVSYANYGIDNIAWSLYNLSNSKAWGELTEEERDKWRDIARRKLGLKPEQPTF